MYLSILMSLSASAVIEAFTLKALSVPGEELWTAL